MRATQASLGILVASTMAVGAVEARELSFEDRVRAQVAIERVYQRHTIGAPESLDAFIPRTAIERKVRTYLAQSVALETYWHTPVTPVMLRQETERILRATKLPGRVAELRAALGNDPFLFQECIARPALVDRLTRGFFAMDPSAHAEAREAAESLRADLLTGRLDPGAEHARRIVTDLASDTAETTLRGVTRIQETRDSFRVETVIGTGANRLVTYMFPKRALDDGWAQGQPALADLRVSAVADDAELPDAVTSCAPDDTWQNGSLDDYPDNLVGPAAVWTGSFMVVWGGGDYSGNSFNTGWRYDPATDTWSRVSAVGAPTAREFHSAVWTGSRMIVWGGSGETDTNTGASYDPVTDTWTAISSTNAPSARSYHRAVWTGSRMIVWGGDSTGPYGTSGGIYDPATDTWTATSTLGAPSGRWGHSMIWTGNQAIVWGGYNGNPVLSGGMFDPLTNTWTPIASPNPPQQCFRHGAVWTGTRMIVYSGFYGSGECAGSYDPVSNAWTVINRTGTWGSSMVWTGDRVLLWGGVSDFPGSVGGDDHGGLYDPATDSWVQTTLVGAPPRKNNHAMVWTGERLIVWGGTGIEGGRYDPRSDTWTPTNFPSPPPRGKHTAVWTGTSMILWGGSAPGGHRYDPALDTWTEVSSVGAPLSRIEHTAVWTGTRMVVWGGKSGSTVLADGGRYSPATDAWEPTSIAGAPSARSLQTAVWTGAEMIVWGGQGSSGVLPSGGRYDPAANLWRDLSLTQAPTPRKGHSAVWTGSAMIVFGGTEANSAPTRTGGRYDPESDSWSPTSTTGAPLPSVHSAIWTGSRMVIWGNGSPRGGRYDPANDTWSAMTSVGSTAPGLGTTAVWTGARMIAWGGSPATGSLTSKGGVYDVASNTWQLTSLQDAPVPRFFHSAVWADGLMLVWGGNQMDSYYQTPVAPMATGGAYAFGQSADFDGDGISTCQGDCDDARAEIHPGALDACNGLDDDCDGTVDTDTDADLDGFDACLDCNDTDASMHPGGWDDRGCDGLDNDCNGVVDNVSDEVCDGLDNDCSGVVDDNLPPVVPAIVANLRFPGKTVCSWAQQAAVRGYDVVRGDLSALRATQGDFAISVTACMANDTPNTSFVATTNPVVGQGWFFLVRGVGCPANGSYDEGVSSQIGSRDPEVAASPAACP